MIVVAGWSHGEFGHVEPTEFDAACDVEPLKHGRCVVGDVISADF